MNVDFDMIREVGIANGARDIIVARINMAVMVVQLADYPD